MLSCLEIKNKGWFVYDPLTNPEVIFELAYYQKNILPIFPIKEIQATPFKLRITKKLVYEFEIKLPKIEDEINRLLSEDTFDSHKLLQDPNMIDSLREQNINPDQYELFIDKAKSYIQAILQSQSAPKNTKQKD